MNPNNVQSNSFFGIKVSKQGIPVQNASDNQLIYKDNFSTKTFYDTNNSRMLEGLLPDGTYGLWVSQPGSNVTDGSNLIFNSNQDIFSIIQSGTIQVPIGVDETNITTIPHNLGFTPIIMAFINDIDLTGFGGDTNGAYPLPGFIEASIGGVTAGVVTFGQWMFPTVDDNNAYIITLNATGTPSNTQIVTYYLLQQTAAL